MAFQLPLLPDDYKVGANDVIIGRGKKCTQNPGNMRFRGIVQDALDSYQNAETKVKKSEIIMDVLCQVREGDGAGFVKIDSATGRYILVEEASCRIAIAQAFRDALSGAYKSSKKHKQMRRLEKKRASATNFISAQQQEEIMRAASVPRSASMSDLSSGVQHFNNHHHHHLLQQAIPQSPMPASNAVFQLRDLINEASSVNSIFRDEATLARAAFQQTTRRSLPTLPPMNADLFANLCSSINFPTQTQGMHSMPHHDPFEPYEPAPLNGYFGPSRAA